MSIKEKREQLAIISKQLRPLVESGDFEKINDAIKQMIYAPEGHTVLKTFNQWKEEGKKVNKGEKALTLWAKPKNVPKKEDGKQTDEVDYSFFPICHLFSQKQVA